ncbi:MAG: YybS family protein [Actinobacteria bacterium]|nr:YybS family protein [Actinomycetota bacterium]
MSFDNLENTGTRKANLAILILFTFLALMITYFLPFVGFVSLAMLPIPCILLLLSGRKRDAVICAVAGVVLLFFLNYAFAAIVLIAIIAISFDYKYFFDKDRKIPIIVFSIFIIFIAAAILYFLIESFVVRNNLMSEISKIYNSYINNLPNDPMIKMYQSMFSAEPAQFSIVLKQMQSFLRFFPKLLPGIFCVFFGATSLINYIASTTILGRYNIKLKVLPKFKEWDISWYWCWGVILGIILAIIPQMNSRYDVLIDVIGYNLIIVFGSLYLILGASTLWGIFERFNLTVFWRYFILFVIILTPAFILLLPVIGLIDIWANFRKLNRS